MKDIFKCTRVNKMRTSASVWVLSALCLYGVFSCARALLTDDSKTEIVHLHNSLRRNFAKGAGGVMVANMGKLEWNASLENDAQEKLNMQCRGTFVKRNAWFTLRNNLKTNSNGNITGDILSWYSEINTNHFSTTEGACGPYQSCLHAYTLLNAKHRTIGCAYQLDCRHSSDAFLCLYDAGTFPFYENGPVCTTCPEMTPFCDDGLCVSCDTSDQGCDCRKTCHNPPIGQGELDNTTCSCTCQYGMGLNCEEPCANPETFVDYDICEDIPKENCNIPDYVEMLNEFCPAKCACKEYPLDGN